MTNCNDQGQKQKRLRVSDIFSKNKPHFFDRISLPPRLPSSSEADEESNSMFETGEGFRYFEQTPKQPMDSLLPLDPLLRSLWFIAIPVSLIFLIQTVMTFIGVETHDGVAADFDGDLNGADTPFQLFTFRNLINFLLGFSWAGISFFGIITNNVLLIATSFIVGSIFVAAFFLVIRQIERLAEDNSFRIQQVVNHTASVYLSIPGRKKGAGKIQVSVKGAVREIDAITENDKIESNAMVRIVRIESGNLAVVEKI